MKNFSNSTALGLHFSTKADGPMNFVGRERYDTERRANRAQFLASVGLKATDTVVPKVVHSSHVQTVSEHNPIYGAIMADSVITNKKGLVLTMNFGDCPPVALYDPVKEVIALIHCGWKPLAGKIIEKTLEKMRTEHNCFTNNIVAYIGPGICQEHYEVGPEVAMKFGIDTKGEKMSLDLRDQICKQLMKGGLLGGNIFDDGECTYHTETEDFQNKYFSWRRDRSNPLSVNMAVFVMK